LNHIGQAPSIGRPDRPAIGYARPVAIANWLRARLPWPLHYLLRKLRALPQDVPALWRLARLRGVANLSLRRRLALIARSYRISYSVDCPHMEGEMAMVMTAILALPRDVSGVVVEAGSYKGGSTSKLSRAARLAGREMVVFDSFEGIPEHHEQHTKNIFGGDAYFPPGSYAGSLEEVRGNVTRLGAIEVCRFVKGWFDDTMPGFHEPVGVAYVDVDLESSTRTCIRFMYPRLVEGGVLFSQDGHLPWVIKLLRDEAFWRDEVGCPPPRMDGLGTRKLVAVHK
jgi:O-methyltransferase